MGMLAKYILRQPNRGFLRKLGFTRTLGHAMGPITTADLRAANIPHNWVTWLSREEAICSSNAAVYIFHGRITDRLARMSRKHPAMTVGLTTALWLAKALPERPAVDHFMLDEAKRRPIWLPPDVSVHRSRHAARDTFDTVIDGIHVPTHLPLRALLDCIRFRDELGDDAVVAAIKAALASHVVELSVLLAQAKLTRVHKPLRRLLAEHDIGA